MNHTLYSLHTNGVFPLHIKHVINKLTAWRIIIQIWWWSFSGEQGKHKEESALFKEPVSLCVHLPEKSIDSALENSWMNHLLSFRRNMSHEYKAARQHGSYIDRHLCTNSVKQLCESRSASVLYLFPKRRSPVLYYRKWWNEATEKVLARTEASDKTSSEGIKNNSLRGIR